MEIISQSATQLASAIRSGQLTSREITTAYLARIAAVEPTIAAFNSIDEQAALKQADQADATIATGRGSSLLCGVPIAIKDNLCTASGVTSCSSKMLANFRSPYNAGVIERLQQANLVMLGKTNMDEFAMGSSTENSSTKVTKNPWDVSRAPGGSSGGSAAAIAAQQAPIALGSDTGGSIRQPASLCGVCGLKPTYGRVSRYGLIAFASSLDQIGPFANDCLDLAAVLQTVGGHDSRDSTSIADELPDFVAAMQKPIENLRIGIVPEFMQHEGLDAATKRNLTEAIDVYRSNGASILEVDLPHAKFGIPTYYIIACSEASSNLSRYSGVHFGYRHEPDATSRSASKKRGNDELLEMLCDSRSEGFGPEVKRRIMLGTYALSAGYYDAYYVKALKVRRLIRNDYDAAFEKVDAILGPTTPSTAFKLGAKSSDPIAMYLEDLFTVGANLSGVPALSMPSGFNSDGMPTSMQLQAPVLGESRLLQIGHWYQRWSEYKPAWPTL